MCSSLPNPNIVRHLMAVLALLSCCSCFSVLDFSRKTENTLLLAEPGVFRYEDRDFLLVFSFAEPRTFQWHFKNKSFIVLEVDQRQVALRRGDDPTGYTLWGKPKKEDLAYPYLRLQSGEFITLTYPVQVNSPFFPFRVADGIRLELTLQWKGRPEHRTFFFQKEPEER